MARCGRCDCPDVTSCLCSVDDGECITVTGTGTALDPFILVPRIDADTDNILACGVAGLAAFVPTRIANPATCGIARTTTQTIPSGPGQILTFNTERWDTDSMHDNTTNSSRITINTAGIYVISALVKWEGNPNNDRKVEIRVNSSDLIVSDERSISESDAIQQFVTTIWKFAAGDYAEVQVTQNSGSSLAILSEGDLSPEFRACLIGVG